MILRGSVYSKYLKMDTGLTIVSPKDYRKKGDYKLCYLLHGLGGNSSSWLDNTRLSVYGEKYDMVFVLPEVGRSYYFDEKYGLDYFSYLVEELPLIVKSLFNISRKREDTIIVGSSIGGYASLKAGLKRPDLYSASYSLAPAFLYLDEILESCRLKKPPARFTTSHGKDLLRDLKRIFGDGLRADEEDILLKLGESIEDKDRLNINIYCGSKDPLLADSRRFKKDMVNLGYKINYRELEGGHDWDFFDRGLKESLKNYYGR